MGESLLFVDFRETHPANSDLRRPIPGGKNRVQLARVVRG